MKQLLLISTTILLCASFNANAVEREKEALFAQLEKVLPDGFCKEGSYFRECFHLDRASCIEGTKGGLEACIPKIRPQIPNMLNESNGPHYAGLIGACVAQGFEVGLAKRRVNSSRCNDPTAWK